MTVKKLLHPFSFFQQQIRELFIHGSVTEKLFFFLYFVASLSLLFYSYTQVDLGLVITRVPWLYAIEKQFQYIGYFNRPLSALLFVSLAIIFLALYLSLWYFVQKKKIKSYTIWSIIGSVTIILTFSYNAFSYDLFNYIFDAKIVTYYHQNPYLHKALDYPQDPMLGFMHWTHNTYPYGPMWLVITVPIAFVGANIFIITLFLFKILIGVSFLVLLNYLFKILQKKNGKDLLANFVLFALNPLVLFECLISAHNDIVMLMLSTAALYFLLQKRYWLSSFLLLISIGIKFATIALLPVFLLVLLFKRREISTDTIIKVSFALMLVPLSLATLRTNFQPWYLLYVLPFVPFVTQVIIRITLILISVGSVFLYTSFLATGDWHSAWYIIPEMLLFWLLVIAGVAGLCYALYTSIKAVFAATGT